MLSELHSQLTSFLPLVPFHTPVIHFFRLFYSSTLSFSDQFQLTFFPSVPLQNLLDDQGENYSKKEAIALYGINS